MSSTENTQVEPVEVIEATIETDYATEHLFKGQYWITGRNTLVAFILDMNEHAIVFQAIMAEGKDGNAVFDFEAGQEMHSHNRFRAYLKERQARCVKPDQKLVDLTLKTYQKTLDENSILEVKRLPRSEEDAVDFLEYEEYTVLRNIIPPPRKFRNSRGIHWLKTGLSGTQLVLKMWDPEKKNWVYPDGSTDITARGNFIKGYHGEAMVFVNDTETETFDQMASRLVSFLKSNGFFFDEKFIRQELAYRDPFQTPLDDVQIQPHVDVTAKTSGGIEVKSTEIQATFDPFAFSMRLKLIDPKDTLMDLTILFERNSKVQYEMTFSGVQNREFIPNHPAKFVGFP